MEGTVLYVSAQPESDPISELSAKLEALKMGNSISLQALNDTLEPFKDGESMRQFGLLMKAAGLCLANGKTYGTQLPQKLRNKSLRVNKVRAKEYPLVKKCLVECH